MHTHGQHVRIGADNTVEGGIFRYEAASIDIGNDCVISTDILIGTGDKHSFIDVASNQPESIVRPCSLVTKAFEEGRRVFAGVASSYNEKNMVPVGALYTVEFGW
ncbi:MAG TPA: hypothetical protein VFF22_05875 [Pseudomonas sp.]|nr:hypothetical protein [Pseudomonas sp.]